MKEFTITLTDEELKMIRTSLDERADEIIDQDKAMKYYDLSSKLMEFTRQ